MPAAALSSVAAKVTEATYLPLPDALGIVSADAVPVLAKAIEGYTAMLLGPGLTHEKEVAQFVDRLLGSEPMPRQRLGFATTSASSDQTADHVALPPLVIDADGLNIMADVDNWWQRLPASSVLTPHPGEMARLTKMSADQIAADRLGIASKFAQEWGHVVVLKGAFSVVAAPDGKIVVMPFANPALATAGSGDVLAGAIVGLRAQGLPAFEAAVCGAYLHGVAGEWPARILDRPEQSPGISGAAAGRSELDGLSIRLPLRHANGTYTKSNSASVSLRDRGAGR